MKHVSVFAAGALSLALLAGETGATEVPTGDWRRSASTDEKVANLVKVMPGAANLMMEMGFRYQNLYWAARLGKWEFASYQAEEIKDLLETLMITRPARAATASEFIDTVFPVLIPALEARDHRRTEEAVEKLRHECTACHVKNDHGFIAVPLPKRSCSPVLNMD